MPAQTIRKNVYENGQCRVIVTLRPEESVYVAKSSANFVNCFLFAIVEVISKDRVIRLWRQNILPLNQERVVKGYLWWKTVRTLTPSDQLEEAVNEAVRFADKYRLDYVIDIQIAENALETAQHLIEATRELNAIDQQSQMKIT